MQELAQNPHLGELTLVGDQLFLAGAGAVDVDRREDTLLGNAPVEMDFAVAGAFEFLKEHVVHLGPRVDQGSREDREAATLFDVARRTEETLRPLQRIGINTTRQHLACRRHYGVVGTCEAGDGVEQNDDVLLVLNQPLRLLDDHFGHLHVTGRRLVERAGHNFALHRALHLSHFLRPLVNQQHDEDDFGMVGSDGGGNVLQQHRLAGLGRGDDETALTLAYRRYQVDGTCRQVIGGTVAALELQALRGMERCQVLEQHLVTRALRRVEIDLTHLEERKVTLAVLRRTNQSGDRVAGAQVEAADLAGADIDVVRAGQIGAVGRSQEAEAVLQNLQHAVAVDVLAVPRVCLEDGEDDVLLAGAGYALQAHRLGQLHQLMDGPGLQLRQVHRSPRLRELRRADDLRIVCVEHLRLMQHVIGPAPTVTVAVAAVSITVAAAMARAFVGPITALITKIASHRLLSRNAESWDLDTAPTFWASTVPFLNRIRVGMPRMPNLGGVCGFSSMFSFAILMRS